MFYQNRTLTSKPVLYSASFLFLFSFFRTLFHDNFFSFAVLKTSAGYSSYILFALLASRHKNKLLYGSILIFPFLFLITAISLTFIFEPGLLLERKILDLPIFLTIEWGPSFIFFCLPLIACTFEFFHKQKNLFFMISHLVVFLSFFYGVRAIIPVLSLSLVYYLLVTKFTKRVFLNIFINCTLLVFYFFITPVLITYMEKHVSNINKDLSSITAQANTAHSKTNLPPLLRKWESPRTSMINDVLTKDFFILNFLGGRKTKFTHSDFKNNSHNFFVDTYWYHGFFATLSLLLALFSYVYSKPKGPNVYILIGFLTTLNLNLTPPWFIILFFVFLLISKEQEESTS